jgi:hypothetical protein
MTNIGVKTGVKTGILNREAGVSLPLRQMKVGAYDGKRNY